MRWLLMSEELRDLRVKITTLTACYLEAESRLSGTDKCALVRQILEEWARRRHGVQMEARRLMQAEGILGLEEGASGRRSAPGGMTGHFREPSPGYGSGLEWEEG